MAAADTAEGRSLSTVVRYTPRHLEQERIALEMWAADVSAREAALDGLQNRLRELEEANGRQRDTITQLCVELSARGAASADAHAEIGRSKDETTVVDPRVSPIAQLQARCDAALAAVGHVQVADVRASHRDPR